MRVGLDIRYLSHGLVGGIHTYVLHLAHTLPRVAPGVEFVYYADRKSPVEGGPWPSNVTVRMLPWTSPWSSVLNDRRLGRWMDQDGVDVAHHPGNYAFRGRCPTVITLHDTLNLFPVGQQVGGLVRTPKRLVTTLYLARATRRTIRTADRVITPSDHARQDAMARMGIDRDRIDVVGLAAAPVFTPLSDPRAREALRARLGVPERFVLADAIKNPSVVIAAFRAVPEAVRRGASLVLFSRATDVRPEVASMLGEDLHVITKPSTPDLAALFALAEVFVFPSWYEGFGLPLVEAMQCGVPVVASTRASIPEVLGGAGLLFDVEDRAGLVRHLSDVLGSPDLRGALRARGLARAGAFSWERTARLTLETYSRAAGRP